jgi:bile acid:Na+ symporter, BASS family
MKFIVAATIMLQVLAVGVQADPAGLLTCVRRPLWLVRIVLAMFIGVPLLAVALVKLSRAPVGMKVAILLMAIAAVAPLLPRKLGKLGVSSAFADSLSVVTMVLAIPLVPITATLLGAMFGREMVVSAASVAGTLATTFLVPFAVGMGLKAAFGERGLRIGEWANTISMIVLAGIVLLLVVAQRGTILPVLWDSLPMVVTFAAGSLLIGHVLGGPDPAERTGLAIATVTRHPGLALLIATASFPNLQVMPPILSLFIGCALVSIPYTAWRKRILAAQPNAAPRAVSAR